MIVIRYADDAVLGFEHRADAVRFQKELGERLAEVRAGTAPGENATDRVREICHIESAERGKGKPETFRFPGFHAYLWESWEWDELYCPAEGGGKKMRAKLQAIKRS